MLGRFGIAGSFVLLFLLTAWACGQQEGSKPRPLVPIPIQQVVIDDDFWKPKLKVWRDVTIPDSFGKFEKDGAFTNFDKIREGTGGDHGGPQWEDGLVYEMIRASADFLASNPDPVLEARLDGYIARIADAAAKDPDGYLNTYTLMKEPAHRWGMDGGNDRDQHDLYNAGALIDASVHYYRATGKTRLLAVAVRLANCMADVMGPPPKKNVIPGHALGEEAMVKLYALFHEKPELKAQMPVAVDEQRYLNLAEFWIENRGNHQGRRDFGSYDQDDKPVLEQESIEGHAVRATLLWSGVVAVANQTGREDYLIAARRIWENMVQRRMYITGGLGSVAAYEGFGGDYDLPNNGYLETCASVGAGFFDQNMTLACADARYADELERVLYNGVLCGVSLKGDTYFYENPLEAAGNRRRWLWHPCPCCPPMFLKIMAALPGCIYAQDADGVYVNQFIGSRATLNLNGDTVTLRQSTKYPWDGRIKLSVEPRHETDFSICIRLPAWCADPKLSVDSQAIQTFDKVRGYARLQRKWKPGDTIELSLPMPVRHVKADPNVRADAGLVALQRGPIVYCVEAADNDGHLRDLIVPPETQLTSEFQPDLLDGVNIIKGTALIREPGTSSATAPAAKSMEFTAIPYFANANRQPSAMAVWLAESPDKASPFTLATRAIASSSHCNSSDTLAALNSFAEPAASDDSTIPRFTWWDHRGTKEWVQYDFPRPEKVSAVQLYWWDERRTKANCRVPQSWEVFYQDGHDWKPVVNATARGTDIDRYNRVGFDAVQTKAVRIEVQLQPGWSGGILNWRIE